MKKYKPNDLNREAVVRWQRSDGDDDPYVVETIHRYPSITVARSSQRKSEAFQNSESGWYRVRVSA